jgi:hypothetical protein
MPSLAIADLPVYWLSLWLLLPPLSQHFDVFAAIAAAMRRQIYPLIEFS